MSFGAWKRTVVTCPRLLCATLALTGLGIHSQINALEVEYLGSITEEIVAPTSIAVSLNEIAVLEPFTRQLKIFTPDGFYVERVNIEGQALGLERLREREYVYCDRESKHVVRVNTLSHQKSVFAGAPSVVDPTDLVVYGASVFVLDGGARQIVEFDFSGSLRTNISLPSKPGAAQAEFFSAIAYNHNEDNFLIFEQTSSTVWIVNADGTLLSSFAGFGSNNGEISRGGALAYDSRGLVYTVDRFQGRIAVYSSDGSFLGYIDLAEMGVDGLLNPSGVQIDSDGVLYVASTESARVHILRVIKPIDPGQLLVALQLFPPENAIVEASSVTLSSEFRAPDTVSIGGYFEFALYVYGDSLNPLQTQVIAGALDTSAGATNLMRGSWTLSEPLDADTVYQWRVRYTAGESSGPWTEFRTFRATSLPREFALSQNFPNPFNPSTVIVYALPLDAHVTLEVINILGQTVATIVDEPQVAGVQQVEWNGANDNGRAVSSGVYFYRMKAEEFVATRKMMLVK